MDEQTDKVVKALAYNIIKLQTRNSRLNFKIGM